MSEVVRLSPADCEQSRAEALSRLGMTLEEARAQWEDCGCCLIDDNWDDLQDLEVVKDSDYLLAEGIYA